MLMETEKKAQASLSIAVQLSTEMHARIKIPRHNVKSLKAVAEFYYYYSLLLLLFDTQNTHTRRKMLYLSTGTQIPK